MTALGVYLLVSLFFVIGTLVEFAIVLFWERKLGLNQRVNFEKKEVLQERTLLQFKFTAAKIDLVSLVLFIACYVLFNMIYWSHYLTYY